MEPSCDLCRAERKSRWYYEDDLCWIADCIVCGVPMAVLKRHTPTPTPEEKAHLAAKLLALGNGFMDDAMRRIPDHYHVHLRGYRKR